jgi:hypothetical protein
MLVSLHTEMFIKYNRQHCEFKYDNLINKALEERKRLTNPQLIWEYQDIIKELFEMKFNKIYLKDVR